MIEIAKLINSKVQGDGGEIYGDNTVTPKKLLRPRRNLELIKYFEGSNVEL